MEKPYVQGKTFGQVCSAMLMLSPARRKQMMDYLSYLMVREKEDIQKKKIKDNDNEFEI